MAFPVTLRCSSRVRDRQRDALLQAGCALAFQGAPSRPDHRTRQGSRNIRPDCETQDFGLLQTMVSAVMEASAEIEPDLWRRYFTIALQGLRPVGAPLEPLPVPPLPLSRAKGKRPRTLATSG
jgi:hypothetical protein